jgi:NAD(P) transhydrogenase subunit alpha
VEAFDTRPAVAEQVRSLGARFVEVDLGETGETSGGYARSLTEEQLAKQRQAMANRCIQSDVVITTAQVFGRRAPVIVTRDIVEAMKPGSIVVDMAVESGGNVEGSELGREVDVGGVRIIGHPNLAGRVPVHASQVYASNVTGLIADNWNSDTDSMILDEEDEIIQGCLITRDGEIVNSSLREAYGI